MHLLYDLYVSLTLTRQPLEFILCVLKQLLRFVSQTLSFLPGFLNCLCFIVHQALNSAILIGQLAI